MRFGICGGPERFDAIRAAGADYLEPPVAAFVAPEQPDSVWHENLALLNDAGLPAEAWNIFLPGDFKIVGPEVDLDRYRRYVATTMERLAEAGAKVIVYGSGGARRVPDGYDIKRGRDDFARAVGIAADAAAPAGILIAVEELRRAETNLLNTVAETAGFVDAQNHPNVRVTADLYHMEAENEGNDILARAPLGHAHVADTGRAAPGTGHANIPAFLNALRANGYDARLSIEAEWTDFNNEAAPALRFLREAWATLPPR